MKEEERVPHTEQPRVAPGLAERSADSALSPLGTPPAPPVRSREGDQIHTAPEFAVGEGDVRAGDAGGGIIAGDSLWRDAWRRLLKNKLAVIGMVFVSFIILASLL